MGACLWGTFRGDYDKAVKCCGIRGDHCLLQNMSIDFPYNKATFWALCMETCKPKALLGGENTLVSSWELGARTEKCIISHIKVTPGHL